MRTWALSLLLAAISWGGLATAGWGAPRPLAPTRGHYQLTQVVLSTPAPFLYNGVTYVPLQDVASLVGASVLLNDTGGLTVAYNGQVFGLTVGSPLMSYGGQVVYLPAAPLNVNGIVYVPDTFLVRYLGVTVQQGAGLWNFRSPHGWRNFRVAPGPPWQYGRPLREIPPVWNVPFPRRMMPYGREPERHVNIYEGRPVPHVNIYEGRPTPHVNIYPGPPTPHVNVYGGPERHVNMYGGRGRGRGR